MPPRLSKSEQPRNTKEFADLHNARPSTEMHPNDLVSALYDAIDYNPPAVPARTMLMEHFIEIGWEDEARDTAREIIRFDPLNMDAKKYLNGVPGQNGTSQPSSSSFQNTTPAQKYQEIIRLKPLPAPRTNSDREAMERELAKGYEALRARARTVLRDTQLVRNLLDGGDTSSTPDKGIQDLKALTEGRVSAVVSVCQPLSARAVARAMEADLQRALDIAVDDLIDVAHWLRSSGQPGGVDNDSVREALAKRIRAIVAALPDTPEELQQHPVTALMHVEHEELKKGYLNDETMYGDSVAEIPRANFYATEDGYAWDMEELAAAITSNSGIMRNPLSGEMFTARDTRAIVAHSHGKKLGPMNDEQSRLSKGVRPTTIEKLDDLAKALLADQSDNQVHSRGALDAFLAYQAILPRAEQHALDTLRVPARDSHTGQSFDCTIGEAVRDAQANKICLHKTGDLIGQAARYLRQSSSD